jgi:signal transduction histidine kinase
MKHSILCVDDELDNVESLARLFRRKYNVLKTTSALEALELLQKNTVTVIISDQRMPNLTGVELLAKSIEFHPNAIRILLTGFTDIDSVVAAINSGQIYRYVTKPWDPVDLTNAIDKAVERYELGEELIEKNLALQKAYEELQTLDQAKSQFMLLVNHELKTPLTSMLSFSDLLSETRLDADQKKMLSRVKTAALRLQEMINDALEYVSAETAQMKVDPLPIAAKSLFHIDFVPEEVLRVAVGRKVSFKLDIAKRDLPCDEKLLRNVFRRLIHNAAKFADAGSEVVVTGKVVGNHYTLTITNAGDPIEERKVANLLKPFTLNEEALNHSVGTGLGLSVCQAILKLHKSSLHFTSKDRQIAVGFSLPL